MIKPEVRAIIAATAIAHASGSKVSSVFDYSIGAHRNIDVSVSGARVTGYDYSTSSHFDGNIPSLYHYGISGHIDFKLNGAGKYDGYDYSTGSFFEVTVRGKNAQFYDYGGSGFTDYSA